MLQEKPQASIRAGTNIQRSSSIHHGLPKNHDRDLGPTLVRPGG
jgi:hypothetical protein